MRLQNTLINPGTHRSRLTLLAGAVSLALSGAGRLRLDAVLARRF